MWPDVGVVNAQVLQVPFKNHKKVAKITVFFRVLHRFCF